MLDFGSESIFLKFSIIPVLYYIYGYLNTGYNFAKDVTLNQLFIKCIPNFIVFFAYFMLTDVFKKTHETELLKNRENLALMQLNTATEQMELLRREEKQSAIYRHDLRHHMNYLNLCITENKLEEATNYIKQIFEEMDNLKVIQYCTNESINLILTLYATKAKNKNIEISIESSATNFSRFQIIDLCSLLSNVLENAVNACEQIDDKSKRYIKFRMYEKNNKLCMYICNSFVTPPVFEHELPISTKKGHGIGVISIVHVVEKYNGIYEFLAENGEFKFQTLL